MWRISRGCGKEKAGTVDLNVIISQFITMEHNPNFLSNELTVDAAAQNHLKETAMWAKFLGIAGFVMSAIILLIAIFAGTFSQQAY